MFKNNLNPPPQKSPSQMFSALIITLTITADDAIMNVISWIHDFPSQNPF